MSEHAWVRVCVCESASSSSLAISHSIVCVCTKCQNQPFSVISHNVHCTLLTTVDDDDDDDDVRSFVGSFRNASLLIPVYMCPFATTFKINIIFSFRILCRDEKTTCKISLSPSSIPPHTHPHWGMWGCVSFKYYYVQVHVHVVRAARPYLYLHI